jgi:hypothetical protein
MFRIRIPEQKLRFKVKLEGEPSTSPDELLQIYFGKGTTSVVPLGTKKIWPFDPGRNVRYAMTSEYWLLGTGYWLLNTPHHNCDIVFLE